MTALLLLPALILDALFGEPRAIWDRLPHPAVLMGRLIAALDRRFNSGEGRRLKGVLVMVGLALGAIALGLAIAALPFGPLWQVLFAAVLLAQRSLVQHVQAVGDALRLSLGDGQRTVAMIVGRDTAVLDRPGVARSAIESAAENFSDGVIAPAFWFLLGGLPGLLLYKITNTADSMIGHLTPRHREFGWAAARFDDLLNLVPARLSAVLIALSHGLTDPRPILRDAPLHRSPNAGWPEAAMAVALDVAISGPRSYHGRLTDYPWVWPEGRHDLGPDDIDRTVAALWRSWGAMLALTALVPLV
ncbi:MAG: cobalamin biosynthesis protein [Rhodobacteraceae bacterium]|nr:cobalamin biosynthesis protein [Paracoccaceae bacterium]